MGTIKLKKLEEESKGQEIVGVQESKQEIVLEKAKSEKKEVLFEDKRKREGNVKHFKMSDGTYQAQIYNEPVHYYDEKEGKYCSIDNTLCSCAKCMDDEDDVEVYENKQAKLIVKNKLYFKI